MTTGIIHDQNLEKHIEKQMGCMAGFFQIFDRHHILTGKRLNSTKRLPPPPGVDSKPEIKQQQTRPMTSPSPDRLKSSPPATFPLPLPVFECKDGVKSSWKFPKEAPRLSLDSRASVDAKGKIRINPAVVHKDVVAPADVSDDKRRSPSVIAKLMGLDQLPNNFKSEETVHDSELRRSASESRISREYRFTDNFHVKQQNQSQSRDNAGMRENTFSLAALNGRPSDPMSSEQTKPSSYRGVWKSSHQQHRKSFFDSADFFPEPKQTALKTRGIDEASKDLETLKQILEAMQLKGLLHSSAKASKQQQISQRNIVYERSRFNSDDQSPIVVMKPSRSPSSPNRAGIPRHVPQSRSPRRERQPVEARSRNSSSPTRRESNNAAKSPCSSPARRRPLSVETQRKANELAEQRRASPVHSPRPSPRRNGSDQAVAAAQLPRNRRSTAEIAPMDKMGPVLGEDESSSSFSEGSVSTSPHTDTEKLKMGERRGGRNLLERCDKLLNSIMEMTATELQPSPVSVLDSSFYKDESSSSPSPVLKRSIDFKDQSVEFEEEIWSPAISPLGSKHEDESEDCDLVYISDVLRAFNYLPGDSDIFLLLEKQQYVKGKDTSRTSRLQRELIFDTITEILTRNSQLPPWKLISRPGIETPSSLHQIWSEFQRIRERDPAEDMVGVICGVLRKDVAGDGVNWWQDCPVEMSEAVLDIERRIFRDLVSETIGDLAAFAGYGRVPMAACRKLVL